MSKRLKKLVALGAATMLGTVAQAATFVSVWDYAVTTQWVAPTTFTAGSGTQIVNASEVSWGGDNNGGAAGVGNLIVGGGERSGLLIENAPQAGSMTTDVMAPQPTATFSHVNNPISGDFATLLSATIESTLTLTPNTPAGASLPGQTINFQIKFAETPNNGSCVVGATSNCDDVFVVTFGSLNQQFDYDGYTYFASIVKTNGPLDPLSPSACAAAGAAAGCLGFLTREGEKTSVDFGIVITSERLSTVPEPGALSLAGLALLGLAVTRRRRLKA